MTLTRRWVDQGLLKALPRHWGGNCRFRTRSTYNAVGDGKFP